MPNAIMKAKSERRRPFIADQIEDCRDASGLFYILPYQKVSGLEGPGKGCRLWGGNMYIVGVFIYLFIYLFFF